MFVLVHNHTSIYFSSFLYWSWYELHISQDCQFLLKYSVDILACAPPSSIVQTAYEIVEEVREVVEEITDDIEEIFTWEGIYIIIIIIIIIIIKKWI